MKTLHMFCISKYTPDPFQISNFALQTSLDLLQITLHPYIFTPKPSTCSVFPNIPLILSNFALQTSLVHIFSTITLNQLILVPKFSGSHSLYLQAINILIVVAFV
jgi:hypothetical protein